MADLFHRVSIRKYQDRPVEREKIVEILRAAMAAPSAKNQQPWEFYVITKKDTLEKLSKASPYAGMTANAPVAIISAYRKDCDVPCYADIDMSIAMENLWLKTDEIGLGGVWLGIAPIEERMKESEQNYYKTCINIEVHFEEQESGLIQEYFPDCQIEKMMNGVCRTFIGVPAKERLWKALLLSFGDRVKVVAPEEYKRELIDTARNFLSNYDS